MPSISDNNKQIKNVYAAATAVMLLAEQKRGK